MAQEQTATNQTTGETVVLRNGQWVPLTDQPEAPPSATNPQTGETVVLQDGAWVPLGESRDNGIYPEMKPGLSQDNPVDLATALTTGGMTREDLLALPAGSWVRFTDGSVQQIETPTEGPTDSKQFREAAPGVMERVSTGEDIARSVPTGLAQGATGIAGLPALARDLTHGLGEFQREQIWGRLGIDPESYQIPGVQQFNEFVSQAPRLLPSSEALNQSLQSVIGQYYQPQTTAGEYSRTVGEFVPNALVPGGLARKAASVVVPALASESLGQIGRDIDEEANRKAMADAVAGATPQEQHTAEGALRFAGGLGGGLATSVRTGGGAERVIRGATRNVTPQQAQMAAALQARSPVPLTNAEALQQVTGGATGLGRVQRVVEGSTGRLGPMMAERPAATSRAIADVLDQIAPTTVGPQVAGQAQEAAGGVLNTMRQRVNESAQPFYDRLPGQELSPENLATLQANPSYARASEELMGNPELAALVSGGPQDLSTVNRVVQQLDTLGEQARPGVMNPQGNNTLAAQREEAARLARSLASGTSEDFAMARLTGATGREAFVDPLRRGPIGAIAGQSDVTPNLGGQTDALFPARPFEGQAGEASQALRLMGEVDPSVPSSLLRQHLARAAAEGTQANMGGANQFGGAKFAAQTAGNPLQEQALLQAVDVAAPTAAPDVRNLFEGLRATGMREPQGSNTAFNTMLQQDLRGGNVGSNLAQSLNVTQIPARIGRAVDDWTARRNAERLAEILIANPDEFQRILMSANRSTGVPVRSVTALSAANQQRED